MTTRKWLSTLMGLPLLTLCAFTLSYRAGAPDSTGTTDDEQAIRQLNEQCLHAHDIADAVTPDRIKDAALPCPAILKWSASISSWRRYGIEPESRK